MDARSCGESMGEVLVRKAFQDKFGIPHALHVANTHEDALGGLHAEGIDDLLTQSTENLALHQNHALVVEPDPAVAQGKR